MTEQMEELYMSDRAKAITWMKRFIKKAKYEPEQVVKNGNEIKWADGLYGHSISMKGEKFIIDGTEMDIDKELWELYFKMREITGSVLVLPPMKFIAKKLSNKIKNLIQKVR